jgi:hypothetical protein
MPDSNYLPPTAEDKDPPSKPGSKIKALMVGLTIDIGGTLLASILILVVYSVILAAAGAPPAETEAALRDLSPTSSLSIAAAVVGCGFSALGGFVCARVARSTNYRLGIVLAAISLLTGFLLSGEQYSLSYQAVMASATVACVLLGTRLGMSTEA